MSAANAMRGSTVTSLPKPYLFWVTRDSSLHVRVLRSSISVPIPDDRQWSVLASECEDWCLDNLHGGVLAEWKGLKLIFHFATMRDAIFFKLARF